MAQFQTLSDLHLPYMIKYHMLDLLLVFVVTQRGCSIGKQQCILEYLSYQNKHLPTLMLLN